jgi:hypothetical protein
MSEAMGSPIEHIGEHMGAHLCVALCARLSFDVKSIMGLRGIEWGIFDVRSAAMLSGVAGLAMGVVILTRTYGIRRGATTHVQNWCYKTSCCLGAVPADLLDATWRDRHRPGD